MKLAELTEKRNSIGRELRELLLIPSKESRDFTTEEKAKKDKLNEAFNAAHAEVQRVKETEERSRELENIMGEPDGDPNVGLGDFKHKPGEDRSGKPPESAEQRMKRQLLATQGWLAAPTREGPTDEQRAAMKAVGIRESQKEIAFDIAPTHEIRSLQIENRRRMLGLESRAMSAESGASGGGFIAETFVRQLELAKLAHGGVLQACDIMTTATGERMMWPTADDTSNQGEQIDENESVETEANPTVAGMWLDSYDFSSKMVKVPHKLLRDSVFDFASILAPMLGERLGRILNTKFTTGTGSGQPKGIVTAATLGVTANSTNPTWDELLDLIYSVPAAYRGDMPGFMFHDTFVQYLQTLKDGEGRPLWLPDPNGGPPARVRNYPYFINFEMASARTSGAKIALFGNLKSYKVRRVGSMTLRRIDELYANKNQVAFIAFESADGNLIHAGINPVRYLQLP